MTKPNIDLAERVMQHIEAHPDEWDQSAWVNTWDGHCNTTMCFAGTTLFLSGYRINQQISRFVTPDGQDEVPGEVVGMLAAELLGMTTGQLDPVFHCYTNDPTVLRERLEHVLTMAQICKD